MKTCTKCKIPKPATEFDKKGKGLATYCKTCRKAMVNGHYQKNKDYYKDKARTRDESERQKYSDYKQSLSCADCGLSFKDKPYLCDFHHDRDDKEINPAQAIRYGFRRFLKEAKKCTPLCANCHRERHNAPIA